MPRLVVQGRRPQRDRPRGSEATSFAYRASSCLGGSSDLQYCGIPTQTSRWPWAATRFSMRREMSESTVRVAVVQAAPVSFDREFTLAKVRTLTREAASRGARLVVFPEAFVSA